MMHNRKFYTILAFILFLNNTICSAQLFVTTITDSTQQIKIANINIQGNKKTKDYIVLREIIFQKGEVILFKDLKASIERSRFNLINTALFNEVKIHAVQNLQEKTAFDILIELKERWYIIPEPVFELYDRNYKIWSQVYERDFNRIKYGIKFKYKNFSGRRDQLSVTYINGFSKEISLGYNQPFADKKLQHGFGISAGYVKRIGVSYGEYNNAPLPRKLCETCPTPENSIFKSEEYVASVNYQYRKGLYGRHFVGLNYFSNSVADTIIKLNPNYFYNGIAKTNFLDFSYFYNFSKVDYFAYPLVGTSFFAGFRNRISTDGLNQLLLYASYSKNIMLNKNLYFSTIFNASTRINQHENSFFNLKSSDIVYGNIRGLEQYLILSKSDVSIRNSLKYKIADRNIKLPIHVKNHEQIPFKIYARVFADGAYVHLPNANNSLLNNKFLKSAGVAIDVITIYDYVFRFELSYNQLGKFSFYIK